MSLNKTKIQEQDNSDEIKSEDWLQIFNSNIRFRILQLLFVYGELSLTELTKHMNKSKSALYHHLQKMINFGVVKVSREEQVRGSIMAKYYRLDEQSALNIQLISEEELKKISNPKKRLKTLESIINTYKSSISLFRKKMDILDLYTDFLEKEVQAREDSDKIQLDFQQLISDYNIGFQAQYLSEKQYKKFIEYYQDFYLKIREMIVSNDSKRDQKNGKIAERPYFVLTLIMPLKKLLDLELEEIMS